MSSRLLTQEQGKPIEQVTGEMIGTIAALRYFAAQALSPKLLGDTANERIIEQRHPLGVVAAITPWNFPMILLMLKVARALITDNTVIAKPAPTTPLTTLLLGEVAADILPPGVFQTLVDQNAPPSSSSPLRSPFQKSSAGLSSDHALLPRSKPLAEPKYLLSRSASIAVSGREAKPKFVKLNQCSQLPSARLIERAEPYE